MNKPLHEFRLNRESLTIVTVKRDQYTKELLAEYPQFADYDSVYQVILSNGRFTYVETLEKLTTLLDYAASGRGVVRRILEAVPVTQAVTQGRQEWEQRCRPLGQGEIQDELPDINLDDLDLDKYL